MQSICVYADSYQYKPIAIVVPVEAALNRFATMKGLAREWTPSSSLVENQDVVAAVYSEMLAVGKRGGLTRLELIQALVLVPDEWTSENVSPST